MYLILNDGNNIDDAEDSDDDYLPFI